MSTRDAASTSVAAATRPAASAHNPRRPPARRNTLDAIQPFLGRLNEGTVHRKVRNTTAGRSAALRTNPSSRAGTDGGAVATYVADAVARGTWAAQYTDAETLRQHTTSNEDEYTEFEARLVREVNTLRRDPKAYAEIVKQEATIGYPYVLAEDLWFSSDADAVRVAEKVEVPEPVLAALQTEANAALGRGGGGGGGGGAVRRPQSSGAAVVVALTGIRHATGNANTATPTATTTTNNTSGQGKSKRSAAADASALAATHVVAHAIENALGPATPERIWQQRLAAQGLMTLDYVNVLRSGSGGVSLADVSPSPLSAAAAGGAGGDPNALIELAATTLTGESAMSTQGPAAAAAAMRDRYTVSGGTAELDLTHLRIQFARYQRRRQVLFKAVEEVRQQRDKAVHALLDAWSVEDEKPGKRTGTAGSVTSGGTGYGSGRRSMGVPRRSEANASPGTGVSVSEAVRAHRAGLLQEMEAYFNTQLSAVEEALMTAQDVARRYMDGANVVLDVARALLSAAAAPPLTMCRGLSLAARETANSVLQYPEECAVLTALSRPATLAAETLMAGLATVKQRGERGEQTTPPQPQAVPRPDQHGDDGTRADDSSPAARLAAEAQEDVEAFNAAEEEAELLAACATVASVLRQELMNLADASHEACSLMGYFSGEVRGLQAYGGGSPRTIVLRLLLGISSPHFTFRDGGMGSAREMLRQDVPEWQTANQLFEDGLFHKLMSPSTTQTPPCAGARSRDTACEPSLTSLFFCGACHPTSLAAAAHTFGDMAVATTSAQKRESEAAQRLAPLLWPEGQLVGCSWQRVYPRVPPPAYDDPALQEPVASYLGSPTMAGSRYHHQRPHPNQSVNCAEPFAVAATLLVARNFEELDLIRQNAHLPLEEVRRLVVQDLVQTAARTDCSDVLVRSNGELHNAVSSVNFGSSAADGAATAQELLDLSDPSSASRGMPMTTTTGTAPDEPRQAVVELNSPSGATLLYPSSHPLVVARWDAPPRMETTTTLTANAGSAKLLSSCSRLSPRPPPALPPHAQSSSHTLSQGVLAQGRHTTTCVAIRAGPPSQIKLAATVTTPQQVHMKAPVTDSRLVLVQRSESDPWVVLVLVDLTMAEALLGGTSFLVHLFEAATTSTQSTLTVPSHAVHQGGAALMPEEVPSQLIAGPFVPIGVIRLVLSSSSSSSFLAPSPGMVVVGGNTARTVSTLRAQTRQQQQQQQQQQQEEEQTRSQKQTTHTRRGRSLSTGRVVEVSQKDTGMDSAARTLTLSSTTPRDISTPWPAWLLRYLPSSLRLRSVVPDIASATTTGSGRRASVTIAYVPAGASWAENGTGSLFGDAPCVYDRFAEGEGWPATSWQFEERCGAVRGPLTSVLKSTRREPICFSIFLPTGVMYMAPQISALRRVLAGIDAEAAHEAALEAADALAAQQEQQQQQQAREEAEALAAAAQARAREEEEAMALAAATASPRKRGTRGSISAHRSSAPASATPTNTNANANSSVSSAPGKKGEMSKQKTGKNFAASGSNNNANGNGSSRRRSSTSLLLQMREEREDAIAALRGHSVTALGYLEDVTSLPTPRRTSASSLDREPAQASGSPDMSAASHTHTIRSHNGTSTVTIVDASHATQNKISSAASATFGLDVWRRVMEQNTTTYARMGLPKLHRVAHELGEEVRQSEARYDTAKTLLTRELRHIEEYELPKKKGKELIKAQADADALRSHLSDLESLMALLSQAEQGAKAAAVQRERDQLLRQDRRAHAEAELNALLELAQPQQTHTNGTLAHTPQLPPTVQNSPAPSTSSSADAFSRGSGRPPIAAAPRRASTSRDLCQTDVRLWLVPADETATAGRPGEVGANVLPLQPSLVVERRDTGDDAVVTCAEADEETRGVPSSSDVVLGVRYDVSLQLPECFAGAAVLLVEGQEAVRWDVRAQ